MKWRNNNREVIGLLARETYRHNRIRNGILTLAVALTVMMIYAIGSVAVGRIEAEYLRYARVSGTTASTILEDATLEQAEQIRQLKYIQNAGMEYYFGGGIEAEEQSGYIAAYVDKTAYEKILFPAYSEVHGTYPKKADEVMLPMRVLEAMEMKEPQIGQELSLELCLDSGEVLQDSFRLSGYYTEYMGMEEPALGFFSKEYYESTGGDLGQASALAIQQKKTLSAEKVEKMLYRDIAMTDSAQQFIGGDTLDYIVVQEIVGGYDIAVAVVFLVLLCVSLLIYNIMHISLQKDIRNYGLMKTLGATIRQITQIVMWQISRILLYGILIGGTVGVGMIWFLLPGLLQERYLDGYGTASVMMGFQGNVLLISIGLSVVVTIVSSLIPVRKVGKMAAVDAMRYIGGDTQIKRKTRNANKGNQIAGMAWRNVFRSKKNAVLTIFSLVLGLTVALGSIVISRGLDVTNEIEKDDDFAIHSMEGVLFTPNYDDEYETFLWELVENIKKMTAVTEVKCGCGGYVRLDAGDTVWQPILTANHLQEGGQKKEEEQKEAEEKRENYMAGINILDKTDLDELEQCVRKYHLAIDMEGLRNGSSAVVLHYNELSQTLKEEGDEVIGEAFTIRNLAGELVGTLKFGGYLSRSQKEMPEILGPAWMQGSPYLIMSEEAYAKLGLKKKIHEIHVNVDRELEPLVKKELETIVEQKNGEERESYFSGGELYFLNAKSEMLEHEKERLHIIRLLMYSISVMLLILGLFHYLNVTIASITERRKELAVMESIGMTRQQLRKMLVLEGSYYTAMILFMLLTTGSGILWGVYKLIKDRKPYMKFSYPYMEAGIIIVVFILICVGLPLFVYRKLVTESVVERLIKNID